MFEKNDRFLLAADSIANILFVLFIVACIVAGIVLCVMELVVLGLCVLFFGSLLMGFMWLITKLLLSFFCDIKLIRNKLYNNKNDGLSDFIEDAERIKNETELKYKNEIEVKDKLLQLKKLLDSGVITAEEFDREKNNLLNF